MCREQRFVEAKGRIKVVNCCNIHALFGGHLSHEGPTSVHELGRRRLRHFRAASPVVSLLGPKSKPPSGTRAMVTEMPNLG